MSAVNDIDQQFVWRPWYSAQAVKVRAKMSHGTVLHIDLILFPEIRAGGVIGTKPFFTRTATAKGCQEGPQTANIDIEQGG